VISEHDAPELFDSRGGGMSQVLSASGRLIVVSGQVALNAQAELIGENDFEAQAVQVFENVQAALKAAGASFRDVVRLGSYLTDITNLSILREVRIRYLVEPFPAATAIETRLALPGLLVEVDAIAVVD